MLSEAIEEWSMDVYAIEVNLLVDTILTTVFDHAGTHPIILASFSPEVCICLKLKQNTYPVHFLTESGNVNAGDVRARSLQEAVHFARAWDLAGTIQRADPLLSSLKLVRYCQQGGMGCATWGPGNDDPENAKVCWYFFSSVHSFPNAKHADSTVLQILADAGIDLIIVNNVKMVAKRLQSHS